MGRLMWIAFGGAIGSVARYLIDGWVLRLAGTHFPFGTFAVNVLGCLVFGIVAGAADERFMVAPTGRAFILIGILGGFTTFSTFTFETLQLVRDAQFARATVNVTGQCILAFLAMWAGYTAARTL